MVDVILEGQLQYRQTAVRGVNSPTACDLFYLVRVQQHVANKDAVNRKQNPSLGSLQIKAWAAPYGSPHSASPCESFAAMLRRQNP